MIYPILKSTLVALLCASLASCGTIARPAPAALRVVAANLAPTQDPRIRAGDAPKVIALAQTFAARMASSSEPHALLALSGGGANGAFGAGVIVGWTERGDRPVFDIVTGVSTGALAAPFAFLGPDWDDELKAAYAEGETQGLLSWRTLAAFVAPSAFSPGTLTHLVEENVTPEMLRAIAAEHARGRRLLVATTNLDAEETVIWDLGVLATQGDAQALILFRQVLVASASIPGVFPPVLIAGLSDGRVITEMHVDGGVNAPFLGVPEALMLWRNPDRSPGRGAIYILVNGQVSRDYQTTPGGVLSILSRSYDSMSKAILRTSLMANAGFAERNGMTLRVAAIPGGIKASSLDFDSESMARLFELGRSRGAAGEAWAPLDGDMLSPPTIPDEAEGDAGAGEAEDAGASLAPTP